MDAGAGLKGRIDMIFTPYIVRRIVGILKSGDSVELKLERGKLVLVRIKRHAEKTDIVIE